ncbi:hypothetical protein JD844_018764 [Phrynosoma platyrhinos]|uniref:Uncharacterized protein n=1 Tax=Phrynosoma platyrhinos TaxID=52577 RepID=A0ABQ7SP34_PHRPL|nr:hypothetical protein JD844_018764 [Phrynosoma platyrhinos]
MEVNVDMLEQMDMMDLSDQDTVDVFLSCGTEDNNNVPTLLPGKGQQKSKKSLLVIQPEYDSKALPEEPPAFQLNSLTDEISKLRGHQDKGGSKVPACSSVICSLSCLSPWPDSNHYQEEISLQVPNTSEAKSRISSTSSASTDLNSLDTSEEGAETPVVQSDEEELQQDGPEEQETKS